MAVLSLEFFKSFGRCVAETIEDVEVESAHNSYSVLAVAGTSD